MGEIISSRKQNKVSRDHRAREAGSKVSVRIGMYVKDLGYDLVVLTPTRVILTAIVYVGVSLKLSSSTYC